VSATGLGFADLTFLLRFLVGQSFRYTNPSYRAITLIFCAG
jgi:hypothetical protein